MAIQRDKVIANAEKLVSKGKIEPAIKEYEHLLEDNPNDVNTLNRIGDLWVRINRTDEACKVFAKIADHYGRDGFFLKAIAIYKKINKLDPSKLDVYGKLADLYAKQGLAMEAKSQYQILADHYLKHGDPQNALVIYKKIAELDPNSINVHVKLADLYSQTNRTAEALKEYDRVGRMLLKRGMMDEAVQVFRKALKIDSGNLELAESLVSTLLESKDYGGATQILETSLEGNRQNPRLIALLGKTHIAKGDLAGAESALDNGLRSNPTDAGLRELLSEVHMRRGNPDRSLATIAPLVDSRTDRSGVDMLNKILRGSPGHIPTLEKLVSVFGRLREETNFLAALNSLAEAHIARGNTRDAQRVLGDLIAREPENAQHRKKLAFVQQQQASGAAPKAAPALSDYVPPTMDDYASPAGYGGGDELSIGSDFSIGLDTSEPIDFSPAPEAQMPPPPMLDDIPSEATIDFGAPVDEDLDFITEHLTEAEVFSKYGLADKAIEHLKAVLERAPKNATALERLYRVYVDEGDPANARALADRYIDALRELGNTSTIESIEQEISRLTGAPTSPPPTPAPPRGGRDISSALDQLSKMVKPKTVEKPLPEPEPEPEFVMPAPEEEITLDMDSGAEVEFDVESLGEDAGVIPEADAIPEVLEEFPIAEEVSDDFITEPLPEESFLPESEIPVAEEESIALESELPIAEEISASDFDMGSDLSGDTDFIGISEVAAEPAMEELGEVDFYIEQELLDEAREKLAALASRYPGHAEVTAREERISEQSAAAQAAAQEREAEERAAAERSRKEKAAAQKAAADKAAADKAAADKAAAAKAAAAKAAAERAAAEKAAAEKAAAAKAALKAAPKPAAKPPAKPAPPEEFFSDDIESELLAAIPEDEGGAITTEPASQAPHPPAVTAAEENLFADEDDFFDLAAELEQELQEDEADTMMPLAEEEQSLEDIFKEFKKGVEQQLDAEDYDTHYNLGIAYKEMGLIDEGIGEFQLASKDPKRTIECCSMLGLCFLEKGMPQLAIKWYRKGLEVPEISEDEHLGLLYDLANVYLEVGDTANAQTAFMEIYGVKSNYRDVISRIKQLEDVKQ